MKTKFLVEHHFSYGWDDAGWTLTDEDDSEKPWLFDTEEEAQKAIDEFINEFFDYDIKGEPNSEYDAADYRIVEVDPTTWKREE
jgi:hypothetical protein